MIRDPQEPRRGIDLENLLPHLVEGYNREPGDFLAGEEKYLTAITKYEKDGAQMSDAIYKAATAANAALPFLRDHQYRMADKHLEDAFRLALKREAGKKNGGYNNTNWIYRSTVGILGEKVGAWYWKTKIDKRILPMGDSGIDLKIGKSIVAVRAMLPDRTSGRFFQRKEDPGFDYGVLVGCYRPGWEKTEWTPDKLPKGFDPKDFDLDGFKPIPRYWEIKGWLSIKEWDASHEAFTKGQKEIGFFYTGKLHPASEPLPL